jgi:hypothetical protein
MTPLMSLWLPIVVAAVAVFVVSALAHMVLTYHRSDYRQLPKETDTLAALRLAGLSPGLYQFPWCPSPKEGGTPEMQAKFQQGPVGMLTVMPPGPMAMGKYLGLWFGYTLVVSVVIAYIAGLSLAPGTDAMMVARVTGSIAVLIYVVANIVDSIWKGFPWGMTVKNMVDGVLYAAVTAAVFAWLWPH